MNYDIYLNKKKMKKDGKRIYSIRGCSGVHKSHVRWTNSHILLESVRFVVQQAGRLDTIQRLTHVVGGVAAKTVHAVVRGRIVCRGRSAKLLAQQAGFALPNNINQLVTYNPFLNTSFVLDEQTPIFHSDFAYCSPDHVIALPNKSFNFNGMTL